MELGRNYVNVRSSLTVNMCTCDHHIAVHNPDGCELCDCKRYEDKERLAARLLKPDETDKVRFSDSDRLTAEESMYKLTNPFYCGPYFLF